MYGAFDTFNDEAVRKAHLNGEAGKELVVVAKAETLLAVAPKVYRLQLVAQK